MSKSRSCVFQVKVIVILKTRGAIGLTPFSLALANLKSYIRTRLVNHMIYYAVRQFGTEILGTYYCNFV